MMQMDEFELARRVYEELPPDAATRDEAFGRLERAIANEGDRVATRHRRRLRLGLVAAATVAAAAVLTVAVVVGPTGTSAAATELRRLGTVAATANELVPGDGQYLEVRSVELRPEVHTSLEGDPTFEVISKLQVDTWIAADGSGFRRTEVKSSAFPTERDRAAWIQAGKPALAQAGDVRREQFGAAEGLPLDISALPTDPDELLATLRSGYPIPPAPADDAEVLDLIGELLMQGDAPPELRSALFKAAAELDDVQLLGDVSDPLGRTGTGLAIDSSEERVELVVNPDDATPLAVELYAPGTQAAVASWRALRTVRITSVIDW
jgi:hypothetical protein